MINFTREQRGRAFDALPKDLKSVITSNTLAETYQKIGTTHKLNLEKIGILADIVTLAILNLIPRENVSSKLTEELGLSNIEANIVTKTINDEVFLKIRELLKKEQEKDLSDVVESTEPETSSIKESANYSDIQKNEILAEIENPTPSVQPISVPDHLLAGPAQPLEITPETKETVAHAFIGSKLTETVSLPSQTASVTLKTPEVKPKSYGPDPYREPIL